MDEFDALEATFPQRVWSLLWTRKSQPGLISQLSPSATTVQQRPSRTEPPPSPSLGMSRKILMDSAFQQIWYKQESRSCSEHDWTTMRETIVQELGVNSLT